MAWRQAKYQRNQQWHNVEKRIAFIRVRAIAAIMPATA